MTCPICQNPAWVVPPPISPLPRILDPILPGPAWCTPGYFLVVSDSTLLNSGFAFVEISDEFWWAPALYNPIFLNPQWGDILGVNFYSVFPYDLPESPLILAGIHLSDAFIAFHVSLLQFATIMRVTTATAPVIMALRWR